MNFNKKLAVAVSGAVLLMAGQFALADSTSDIVDALVGKGVLTEEEGKLISKGHETKKKADEKTLKSKINIGSFIENATMYGDIRARYERRDGDVIQANNIDTINSDLNRTRFKITFGIKTETKNAYSDFAMVMGDNVRSDNTSMGENGTAGNN
jgi:polyhydroxyalkanoate synthesis regulator phasin